jgi:hypothetical protein
MPAWKETHLALVGASGLGKTAMAAGTLAQSIRHGHATYVLDAKGDYWCPRVLQAMCERYGRPFVYIDLNLPVPQLNPLHGVRNERELEVLFFETFQLARRFDQYDYFRLVERWAASAIADVAAPVRCSVADISRDCDTVLQQAGVDLNRAQGVRLAFAELARVTAICSSNVNLPRLHEPLSKGGCIYIRGSLLHDNIKAVMRMLLLRLMQIAEAKPRGARHMTVFSDDFKFTVGDNAVNMLETVRHLGCNLMLAFTAFDDLGTHYGAVMNNCAVQAMFRATSPEMADWMSKRSGMVLKRERHLELIRNMAGRELQPTKHREREVQGPYLEVNEAYALPKFVSAIYGLGPVARIGGTSPIYIQDREITIQRGPKPGSEGTRLGPASLIPPAPLPPTTAFKVRKKSA